MPKVATWKQLREHIRLKAWGLIGVVIVLGLGGVALAHYCFEPGFFHLLFQTLGVTLIATAIVSCLYETLLRFDIVRLLKCELSDPFPARNNIIVRKFGIDRSENDFRSIWNNANGYMKIIGGSCNDILAQQCHDVILNKLRNDSTFDVKVLLLCPWSITAEVRAEASREVRNDARSLTITTIGGLLSIIAEDVSLIDRINLRIYDAIPSLSMIISKNEALVAPFTAVQDGSRNPFFIASNIESDNDLYRVLP